MLEGAAAETSRAAPLPAPHPARWWRAVLMLLVLEPLALAGLYFAQVGVPSSAGEVNTDSIVSLLPRPVAVGVPEPDAYVTPSPPLTSEVAPASTSESHVTQVRGKFLIELRGAPIGTVLDLLSHATGTAVTGTDVFAGNPYRFNRSLVALSPQEAWQTLFGELASFVIACPTRGCAVHFVAPGTRSTSAMPSVPGAALPPAVSMRPYDSVSAEVAVESGIMDAALLAQQRIR